LTIQLKLPELEIDLSLLVKTNFLYLKSRLKSKDTDIEAFMPASVYIIDYYYSILEMVPQGHWK